MKSFSESYKEAGVDITAGYRAVDLMKKQSWIEFICLWLLRWLHIKNIARLHLRLNNFGVNNEIKKTNCNGVGGNTGCAKGGDQPQVKGRS